MCGQDLPELPEAPWNRCCQTKSEARLSFLKHWVTKLGTG